MQANSNLDPLGQNLRRMQFAEEASDAIPFGCYRLDDNGRFLYVNRKAEALLGAGSDKLLGRAIWDVLPEQVSMPYFKAVIDALESKIASEYEYFSFKGNTWIKLTASPLEAGVLVVITECNEIHETKARLMEEQRRLAATQKIGQMGYFEGYLDTEDLYCSNELFYIHGLEPANKLIPFENHISMVHPDDQASYRLQLKEGINRQQPFEVTNRIIRTDGEVRLLHRRAEFLKDEQGKVNRIYGIVQDITRQCSHELILNNMNEVCFELDTNFRIVNANYKALNTWGKSASEVIGKWIWNLFPEHLGTPFHETLVKAMDGKKQVIAEAQCPVINKWFYIHANPSHNGLIVLHLDVTPQRAAEAKVIQLQSEQQLEIFKATISTQEEERKRIAESLHNGIGQILYGVKMSLDQVSLNNAGQDQTSFYEAKRSTEQLLADAIKETRRISHELTPSILEDFGLEEAITDICRQFNHSLSIKSSFIGLKSRLDKYIETSVFRMVQELVLNTIKHARATQASVEVELANGQITLNVWDNGIGFNPRQVKGKGIGWRTINNKVELLNGTVTINNSEGTKITITIPYREIDKS